jgi:hypothetical protein
MMRTEVISDWVYEHYYIYLHLAIADADNLITDKILEELKMILFKSLDENRVTNILKDVFREFRTHNKEEKRAIIKDHASKHLRTEAIKNKVIADLENITNKDEESEEQIMFRFIRKVINNIK